MPESRQGQRKEGEYHQVGGVKAMLRSRRRASQFMAADEDADSQTIRLVKKVVVCGNELVSRSLRCTNSPP